MISIPCTQVRVVSPRSSTLEFSSQDTLMTAAWYTGNVADVWRLEASTGSSVQVMGVQEGAVLFVPDKVVPSGHVVQPSSAPGLREFNTLASYRRGVWINIGQLVVATYVPDQFSIFFQFLFSIFFKFLFQIFFQIKKKKKF